MSQNPVSTSLLTNSSLTSQWGILIGLSIIISVFLTWLGAPAALFLGPMIAGIVLTTNGGEVVIHRWPYAFAQAILGCMITKMLPLSIAGNVFNRWPIFVAGAVSVIIASSFLGWLMNRMRLLPGTTIVWGLSPGAATVMTLMAENYGADAQLVAFMQYFRVIMVAAIASIVARAFGMGASHVSRVIIWFPAVTWVPLIETLTLAVLSIFIAHWFRFRAGAFLIPLIAGIILTRHGIMTIELPRWLLATGYAFIGWRIGLRFTRPLLLHATKALPTIIVCTLILIAICGLFAVFLVKVAGIDPLTAYLATSPGGADSVAIIAASSNVDMPFVMTMQTMRFLAVLLIGPAMARFIAKQAGAISETP